MPATCSHGGGRAASAESTQRDQLARAKNVTDTKSFTSKNDSTITLLFIGSVCTCLSVF